MSSNAIATFAVLWMMAFGVGISLIGIGLVEHFERRYDKRH